MILLKKRNYDFFFIFKFLNFFHLLFFHYLNLIFILNYFKIFGQVLKNNY